MKKYDEKNLNWTKKHGIRIPFIKEDGINSFYVPDFLINIDNFRVLVEIKGWLKREDEIKAETAIRWCLENDYEYYFLLGKEFILIDELSFGVKYKNIV